MEPFGFLAVDKPQGLTSHNVVAKVRRGTGVKRIGHAGTLDPMATGVLVLCVGLATRLCEYVTHSVKTYTATIRLGVETDTYDADGRVSATRDTAHLTAADIESALACFQGEIEQIPPMYSAIKQGGKKLYELAREGKEVERTARKVWLETRLLALNLPELTVSFTCSPGTYIRSIAHDLGKMLGVGGHLTALRRNAGGWLESDSVPWQTLVEAMADGTWERYLLPESRVLAHIPALTLDEQETQHIVKGRTIPRVEPAEEGDLRRTYSSDARFTAIVSARGDTWQPVKVFTT